ncbi:MAG TPA: cell division protein ZapA [Methylomirabilota bacterium]|jgi:cell division protein ZapA (FtsZ GTPase activity inhibitor)|nr:cell division protein ZapA [Methylomirabilota bacterium]
MPEPERVDLVLLGQKLTVRTEASPEYLRTLADFLEERVGVLQRSGVRDPFKALLLAALDIADELHRAREERHLDEGEVGARLRAVIARLDELSRQAP